MIVNLVSVRILGTDHHHSDDDEADAHHHHEDHNLKVAYLHVLADALTSVLAIIALVAGSSLGWVWLDALMGIGGSLVSHYQGLLTGLPVLAHVTIQINVCDGEGCLPAASG